MSEAFKVDVRLWKEMPNSYWFLPKADAHAIVVATSLATAVDIAEKTIDWKPAYFQAMPLDRIDVAITES